MLAIDDYRKIFGDQTAFKMVLFCDVMHGNTGFHFRPVLSLQGISLDNGKENVIEGGSQELRKYTVMNFDEKLFAVFKTMPLSQYYYSLDLKRGVIYIYIYVYIPYHMVCVNMILYTISHWESQVR